MSIYNMDIIGLSRLWRSTDRNDSTAYLSITFRFMIKVLLAVQLLHFFDVECKCLSNKILLGYYCFIFSAFFCSYVIKNWTNEREKKLKQWIETWSVSFVYVRMIMSFAIEYNKKKKKWTVSFLSFFFFLFQSL